ncbi:MAG TPA: hypothetical protein VFV63_04745 [Ilumatobacteraceae bacterium]|nr:hypothetical protein [Ilumatobacteraceae bacterium]
MSMHTHADGTRHHDHDTHGGHDAPVVRNAVSHTVHHVVRGGPPVLDIGGDIGAMVVLMDPATAGTELHLRSEHEPPVAVHTGVWTRPHGTAMVTAAVFAELVAGHYWVLDPDGHDVRQVVIAGGELTQIDLRPADATLIG